MPFKEDALEPFISKTTISTHYNKHHGGYVKKLNAAVAADERLQNRALLDFITNARDFDQKIVNLASQIFNHEFYWQSINPYRNNENDEKSNGNKPFGLSQELYDVILADFESFDKFGMQFKDRAKTHFGSGWIWFVIDSKYPKLRITEGHDADCPLSYGDTPLLTIDIWEHAYYLDYKNERARYVEEFWNRINWQFVSQQFVEGQKSKKEL